MPRVKPRAARNEPRERDIERALEERADKGTSFVDLNQKYGILKSTLCNRSRGMQTQTRQKSHEAYQALQRWRKRLVGGRYKSIHRALRRDWIYSKLLQKSSYKRKDGVVWVLPGFEGTSTDTLQFQYALHRQLTAKVHLQMFQGQLRTISRS